MVARGCGASRTVGAIYAECPLSARGLSLEYCLVDPPIPVDCKELGITQVGVKLVERNGVWHIMDWVGSAHYNNVADYVEEVRRFGLSRRLATNLDFKKLTSQSRILLLHSRAYIYNYDEYKNCEPDVEELEGLVPYPVCPRNLPQHKRPEMSTMCARLWYQDVTGGDINASPDDTEGRLRRVIRKMPSFQYFALTAPEGVKPNYKVAIFASFPIANLAVVKDEENGLHNRSLAFAKEARIPVKLVDE